MVLIVLPQALKLVIPGIVNTFIALFKDTTLVLIIGLFDLLGSIQARQLRLQLAGILDRGLRVRGLRLLGVLLRHVALQPAARAQAAHGSQALKD